MIMIRMMVMMMMIMIMILILIMTMITITKTKTKFTCYSFLTSSQLSSIIAWIALTTRFEPEKKESSIIILKINNFQELI